MANRWNQQFGLTFEKKVVKVYAKVTFGASGTPTLSATNSKGVLSITQNGTGDYTFIFGVTQNGGSVKDVYVKLLSISHVYNSGNSAPAAPGLYVKTDNVATAAAPLLRVILNSAGTATNPGSGEIGYYEFTLGDSTAP